MKRVQIQGACVMEKGCEAGMQWEPVSQYTSKPCYQVSNHLESSGNDSSILEGCIREIYRLLLWTVHAREEERHLSTPPKLPLVWAAHLHKFPPSSQQHLSPQHLAGVTWGYRSAVCTEHMKCDAWSCVCGNLVQSVRGSWGWQVARNGEGQEDLKWHVRGVWYMS